MLKKVGSKDKNKDKVKTEKKDSKSSLKTTAEEKAETAAHDADDQEHLQISKSDLSLLRKYGFVNADTATIWAYLKSDPRDASILDQAVGKTTSRKYEDKKSLAIAERIEGDHADKHGRRKMKNTRFDPTLWDPAILNRHVDGTILFKIIGATNLANTDTVGVSDPYCVVRSTFSTLIHGKTKVIKNSLNPRWDHTFKFEIKQRNALGDFHINLFDHDMIGKDDWLGVVVIPLYNIVDAPLGVGLQGKLPFAMETKQKKKDEPPAFILIDIKFQPSQKAVKDKPSAPVELIKGSLTSITTEEDFAKDYEMVKVLGTGATAEVKLAKSLKETDKQVAIKIVDKNSEMWEDEVTAEKFAREVEIMGKVRSCENLVAAVDLRETDQFVYIVMDLSEFELFDYIMSQEEQHCTEAFTARVMYNVFKGLEFLHDNNICHRDMKAENVLLSFGKDKTAKFPTSVKVSDYGESVYFTDKKPTIKGFVGTPPYMAPEIVDDSVSKYTKAVDIWACGIMAHATLVGYLPFDGDNDAETYQLILEADLQFPEPDWDGVDPLAMAFISVCLTYESKKRLDVKSAMKHPWIVKHNK